MREYDPEIAYKILVACQEAGITTEKGKWVISRVKELREEGSLNAVVIAFNEASDLWQGFDVNKPIPKV